MNQSGPFDLIDSCNKAAPRYTQTSCGHDIDVSLVVFGLAIKLYHVILSAFLCNKALGNYRWSVWGMECLFCDRERVGKALLHFKGRLQVRDYNALHGFSFHHNRGREKPITEFVRIV